MGAGGIAVSPFFCRLDLCDDMVGGGIVRLGPVQLFVCAGPSQNAQHTKKIVRLITHCFGGNRTVGFSRNRDSVAPVQKIRHT